MILLSLAIIYVLVQYLCVSAKFHTTVELIYSHIEQITTCSVFLLFDDLPLGKISTNPMFLLNLRSKKDIYFPFNTKKHIRCIFNFLISQTSLSFDDKLLNLRKGLYKLRFSINRYYMHISGEKGYHKTDNYVLFYATEDRKYNIFRTLVSKKFNFDLYDMDLSLRVVLVLIRRESRGSVKYSSQYQFVWFSWDNFPRPDLVPLDVNVTTIPESIQTCINQNKISIGWNLKISQSEISDYEYIRIISELLPQFNNLGHSFRAELYAFLKKYRKSLLEEAYVMQTIRILLDKSNSSVKYLTHSEYVLPYRDVLENEEPSKYNLPLISALHKISHVVLPDEEPRLNSYTLVEVEHFSFITCYANKFISFNTYSQPFQTWVWLWLFISLLVLSAYLHATSHSLRTNSCTDRPTKSRHLDFYPYLTIFSTILEQSVSISDKITKKLNYRVSLGIWFVMSIIFSNAYKGIAITGVTSPLPGQSPEVFENLTSYVYKCKPKVRGCKEDYDLSRLKSGSLTDFKILSQLVTHWGDDEINSTEYPKDLPKYKFGNLLNFFSYKIWRLFQYYFDKPASDMNWVRESRLLRTFAKFTDENFRPWYRGGMDFMNPKKHSTPGFYHHDIPVSTRLPYPPPNSAIEEELVRCGRTVLVDTVATLANEMEHLRNYYPWLPFVRSRDSLYPLGLAWAFSKAKASKLPLYFRIIVESGIYSFIKAENDRAVYFERAKFSKNIRHQMWERVKPIKITDSIQTIYFICLSCTGVTFVVFALELLFANKTKVIGKVSCYYERIRQLRRVTLKDTLKSLRSFLSNLCRQSLWRGIGQGTNFLLHMLFKHK